MQAYSAGKVSEAQVSAMLGEMVRETIAAIIDQQEQAPAEDDDGDGDGALAEIAARRAAVTGALRTRDWPAARAVARKAAQTCAVPEESLTEPGVARQVLLTMRRLFDIAGAAARDFEGPMPEGRDLLDVSARPRDAPGD